MLTLRLVTRRFPDIATDRAAVVRNRTVVYGKAKCRIRFVVLYAQIVDDCRLFDLLDALHWDHQVVAGDERPQLASAAHTLVNSLANPDKEIGILIADRNDMFNSTFRSDETTYFRMFDSVTGRRYVDGSQKHLEVSGQGVRFDAPMQSVLVLPSVSVEPSGCKIELFLNASSPH